MLLIAEYKELQHTQYGHNFIAKHMPDFPLLMDDSILKRFSKAFSGELEMLRAHPTFHLMTIGTFSFSELGIASLKRMDVMMVTRIGSRSRTCTRSKSSTRSRQGAGASTKCFASTLRLRIPSLRCFAGCGAEDYRPLYRSSRR